VQASNQRLLTSVRIPILSGVPSATAWFGRLLDQVLTNDWSRQSRRRNLWARHPIAPEVNRVAGATSRISMDEPNDRADQRALDV
jgi:hypothetical protein